MLALHAGADDDDPLRLGAREHVRRARAGEARAHRGQIGRVHDREQLPAVGIVQAEHAANGGLLGRELRVDLDGVRGDAGDDTGKEDRRGAGTGQRRADALCADVRAGRVGAEPGTERRHERRRIDEALDL